ncbi:MAG: hypothetical protein H0V53_14105 [Rubrobacter sp.]|jgi:hypothetical protein|nr:hypothetical protein [Rubrobacter sp.]
MDNTKSSASSRAPTTREDRGLQLFRGHSADIWRVEPHVYRVPSCSSSTTIYLVTTRQGREFCPCPDHYWTGRRCMHLVAAQTFRARSGACADCKTLGLRRELYEVEPGHLTWYEGDELCWTCAGKAGVR